LGLVDQALKYWFRFNSSFNWHYDLALGVSFFLSLYQNAKAAFSLPVPARIVAIVTFIIVVLLVYKMIHSSSRERFYLLFLIVGALSNLYDRIYLGGVVDYFGVSLNGWRSSYFNLADVMIVIGLLGWCRALTAQYELYERMRGNGI
ncbi:signal peptidase II, partial [Candidatus Uhrbacteria bacterium]|nr:signal peptidase II [Candidatus Uhrbacteria bacterium]